VVDGALCLQVKNRGFKDWDAPTWTKRAPPPAKGKHAAPAAAQETASAPKPETTAKVEVKPKAKPAAQPTRKAKRKK
jgi:hypothetical protein